MSFTVNMCPPKCVLCFSNSYVIVAIVIFGNGGEQKKNGSAIAIWKFSRWQFLIEIASLLHIFVDLWRRKITVGRIRWNNSTICTLTSVFAFLVKTASIDSAYYQTNNKFMASDTSMSSFCWLFNSKKKSSNKITMFFLNGKTFVIYAKTVLKTAMVFVWFSRVQVNKRSAHNQRATDWMKEKAWAQLWIADAFSSNMRLLCFHNGFSILLRTHFRHRLLVSFANFTHHTHREAPPNVAH